MVEVFGSNMDPNRVFTTPNGLPSESKLASYLSRGAVTPTRSLNDALSKMTIESSPQTMDKLGAEFIPLAYYGGASAGSPPAGVPPPPVLQENVGGTTYFYPAGADAHHPIGGGEARAGGAPGYGAALYGGARLLPATGGAWACPAPCPAPYYCREPPVPPPPDSEWCVEGAMYGCEAREVFRRRDDAFLPHLTHYPEVPENVEMYTELVPLEGAPCAAYRATHRRSGEAVALRRLRAPGAPPPDALALWKTLDHPNVVRLLECFPTRAFDDHSLVLVYAYHAGCETLRDKYLAPGAGAQPDAAPPLFDPFSADPDAPRPYTHQKNAMLRAVASGALLPEALLWSLLVQLTAALRAIHGAGLACRSLDPSKVVMVGGRARIAWGGAGEAAGGGDAAAHQQEDLAALGRLVLALACRSLHCDDFAAALRLVARTYSADLKNVVLYLLSPTGRRSVADLMPMIGARFYTQVEALQRRVDGAEAALARDAADGRLLRVALKLAAINERPELLCDGAWSETGDRYLLKLFRDHVFHAVDAAGRPFLDRAHVAHALNRLDAASPERVELVSRDHQSVLVVTYAELKHCLDAAYQELMAAATP